MTRDKRETSCKHMQVQRQRRTSYEDKNEQYIFGRGPRCLFNDSASWCMCHDSSMHLAYKCLQESRTCALSQSIWWSDFHACSAIAEAAISPLRLHIDVPSVCIPMTFQNVNDHCLHPLFFSFAVSHLRLFIPPAFSILR